MISGLAWVAFIISRHGKRNWLETLAGKEKFTITNTQRHDLKLMLRSPKTAQDLASQAKIVLLAASGKTVEELIVELDTTLRTTCRWRKGFKEHGIQGIVDCPRSGQPKNSIISKEQ